MINIFKTEDFEKYPELHNSIITLVRNWLDKQTALDFKKGLNTPMKRKMYRTLYKKLSTKNIVDMLVKDNIRILLSEILIVNIYYHLMKHVDPDRYNQIMEILKSENKLKIKKKYNLSTLLSIYLNIAKHRIDDSIRKKHLRISPIGEIELFIEANSILNENKKHHFRITKKNALLSANKKLNVFNEGLVKDNIFLKKLVNRFKQFEQREAKKKIKRVNRITKI